MSERFSPSNASDRTGRIRRPQPLSREFSDADRTLDARLAELAEHSPVPPGLAGRVFDASRPLLSGGANASAESAPLRFPGAGVGLTRRVGARLATAAAVGLLAVVTWWSTWQGAAPASGTREVVVVAPQAPLETRDVAWHAADALDAAYKRISTYIVASEDIHSAADVETELVRLFPELVPATPAPMSTGR